MWLPLESIVFGLAVVVAVIAVVLAITRRSRPRWYRPALGTLEALLVAQAALAALLLLRGHRPDEPVTFLAYAATSLLVVPALLALLSSPDEEYGGPVWPHLLVTVAMVAVAVIVLRMGATWPATSA